MLSKNGINRKGIALITTLFVLMLVAGLTLLLFTRTINEINHSREGAEAIQTLMLARAAAVIGQQYVNENNSDFRQDVQEVMSLATTGASGTWFFGTGSGAIPEPRSVGRDTNMAFLLSQLQMRLDTAFCSQEVTPTGSVGTISLRVYVENTACGESLPSRTKLPSPRFVSGGARVGSGATSLQVYSIPYVLVATGQQGEYERQMVVQGEFHVTAGSSSFARYAYFTNRETFTVGGSPVNLWFNTNTLIDGPVHTNSNFRFDGTSWFGGDVSSAGCQDSTSVDINACSTTNYGATFDTDTVTFLNPNTTGDPQNPVVDNTAPSFDGPSGVAWNAAQVPLPENTVDQRNAARGLRPSGIGNAPTQGIHLTDAAGDGSSGLCSSSTEHCSLTIWAAHNPGVSDVDAAPLVYTGKAADGTPQYDQEATHQYIQWCPTAPLPSTTTPTASGCSGDDDDDDDDDDGGSCSPAPPPSPTPPASDCVTYRTYETSSGELALERFDYSVGTFVVDDARSFNGVIYTDVPIQRLTGKGRSNVTDPETAPPALANFSQLTIASSQPIRLTGDLKYEQPPRTGIATRAADGTVTPAGDINDGATNILGIYSEQDLLIGNGNAAADLNAPDDVMVHASLMSGQGSITVEDYNRGVHRGNFQLIGGMIQTERGPFGTFSGNTPRTGFSRTYTYDKRFLAGLSPPFFPTTADQSGDQIFRFVFGIREQAN